MLVIDVIVNQKAQKAAEGLTASERLVSRLAALRSDANQSPSGRPIAVARFLESLLGTAASFDSNRRVVIQAGTQVLLSAHAAVLQACIIISIKTSPQNSLFSGPQHGSPPSAGL